VELTGKFKPGVDGRDLIHKIIQDHGCSWANDCCLEFMGPGAANVSIDQRMNTMIMLCFTGALTGAFLFDEVTKKYLENRNITGLTGIYTDEGANIKEKVTYDLGSIEPLLVSPGGPGNVIPIESGLGVELDQGFIGSCASGRIEDLAVAASILKGHKIKNGFRLYIVPPSNEIMVQAAAKGYLEIFAEAGAFISSGSCDYCFGRTQCLAAGERSISTGTLNVPGRMGSTDAEIYLANTATVAASAIIGKITDPRGFIK
jgi:3-isopropylmalate/(R)-2-methylmalate dehydratase large subunit